MTKPRKGIGVSPAKVIAPRLRVGGTLSAPNISVDSTTTALSTGAAYLSGGLSVLATGIWDRLSSSGDACGGLYRQATQMPAFAEPAMIPEISPAGADQTTQ